MLNKVAISDVARVVFKLTQPLLILVCLATLVVGTYVATLDDKLVAVVAESPFGAASVTLDRSGWVVAFDGTVDSSFGLHSESYRSELILDSFSDLSSTFPLSSWRGPGVSVHHLFGMWMVTLRYGLVMTVVTASLFMLIFGRSAVRFLRSRRLSLPPANS